MGTAATVFAMNASGLVVASDCSKASKEFWIGTTSPWVSNNVTEYINTVNYASDYSINAPDNKGWRKSFLAFTGYSSMNAFYAAFDAWYRSLPDPGTNFNGFAAGVKAILESDESIKTQATAKYEDAKHVNLAHIDNLCGCNRDTGSGGGGSGGGGGGGGCSRSSPASSPTSAPSPTSMPAPAPSMAPPDHDVSSPVSSSGAGTIAHTYLYYVFITLMAATALAQSLDGMYFSSCSDL